MFKFVQEPTAGVVNMNKTWLKASAILQLVFRDLEFPLMSCPIASPVPLSLLKQYDNDTFASSYHTQLRSSLSLAPFSYVPYHSSSCITSHHGSREARASCPRSPFREVKPRVIFAQGAFLLVYLIS